MKLRLAQPEHLVDLGRIAALKGIRRDGAEIVIGAMTTQAEIIGSALLGETAPILAEAAKVIADPQVRYAGTIGGNVANGDPGNDMPGADAVPRCALHPGRPGRHPQGRGARLLRGGRSSPSCRPARSSPSSASPSPAANHGWAYEKLKRKIGDYAVAAAAVTLTVSGGKCASAAIALTNVAQTPLLAVDAAKALVGSSLDKSAIDAAAKAADGDLRPGRRYARTQGNTASPCWA